MSEPPGQDGRSTRLEDALVFQIDERDIELMEEDGAADDAFAQRFARAVEGDGDLWHQDAASGHADDLFGRINEVQGILSVLRACLPESKGLLDLDQKLVRAAEQASALALEGASHFDPRTEALEAEVASIENTLLETERRFPLSWLSHRMDDLELGDAALAHYLRFQMKHLKLAPTGLTRVDIVVSRLAATRDAQGVLHLRPPAEVAKLISACVPQSTATPHVRNNALLFFHSASDRLQELGYVEEFFESGLYVDILGYKLALRQDYFDPRILYTAAELNAEIENWVRELGMNMRMLDSYFAEGREKVRKILNRSRDDLDGMTERWNREYSGEIRVPRSISIPAPGASRSGPTSQRQRAVSSNDARRTKSGAKRKPKRKQSSASSIPWRTMIASVAIILAVIYIAPTVIDFFRGVDRGLQPVSDSEIKSISPLLVEGSWAGKSPDRLFIGHLDPEAWRTRNDDERLEEARFIRDQLGFREIDAALIYMRLGRDKTLVLNIMEGEIRYLQPNRK